MCGGGVHQGVALSAAAHEYSTVEDILNKAAEKNEKPFIIICDGVEDTHNLGAVIRTADAAGAHGVIIPKRRSASLNFTVGKTSAGALEYVPVARVANLASTIDELKEKIFGYTVPIWTAAITGLWIIQAESLWLSVPRVAV